LYRKLRNQWSLILLILLAVNNNKSVAIDKYVPEYFSEETAMNGTRRWTIAALVSPTYYTSFNSGSNEATTQLMSEEQTLISYAGGLALSYKINRRLSVQSGLYYSSFGNELSGISSFGGFQQYDNTKGDHNFEVLTMNGTVYTSNADVFLLDNLSSQRVVSRISNDMFDPAKANLQYLDNSLRQNFSYLELPFVLKYKVVDRAIDFNIIGGLSSNILVTNSVYANLDGTKYPVGKTEGLNMITFSSSLGMGMEYSLTNNLSLNLEPTFRYYLNSFNEIPGMRVHPYSFGLFSGISYKF
jgi:opacity protein-like surface antigen